MYGWRARLGVLVPAIVLPVEPEFELMKPDGVSFHYQRFVFSGGGIEGLKAIEKVVAEAAEIVSLVRPAAIAMCCTGGSFAGGYGYDRMLIRRMQEKNGNLPTTTASTSVIEALKRLGAKKISMAVPYLEEIATVEKKFVEDHNIKVNKIKWLGLDGFAMNEVPYETVYSMAREADDPESEAIFISCVGLHTVEIIEALELDLKKPVVSSNQATMWNLLRLAGVNEPISGFGKLLEEY